MALVDTLDFMPGEASCETGHHRHTQAHVQGCGEAIRIAGRGSGIRLWIRGREREITSKRPHLPCSYMPLPREFARGISNGSMQPLRERGYDGLIRHLIISTRTAKSA